MVEGGGLSRPRPGPRSSKGLLLVALRWRQLVFKARRVIVLGFVGTAGSSVNGRIVAFGVMLSRRPYASYHSGPYNTAREQGREVGLETYS